MSIAPRLLTPFLSRQVLCHKERRDGRLPGEDAYLHEQSHLGLGDLPLCLREGELDLGIAGGSQERLFVASVALDETVSDLLGMALAVGQGSLKGPEQLL